MDFDVLFPNAYLLPAPGVPPVGLGLAPAKSAFGRARDRLITSLTMREWDKGVPGLNDLRASLGLDPIRSFFDQIHRARRELVLTSPDFDFPGDLPPNVRYVGAILDDPEWASAVNWTPPAGDQPLVLVALSSTFQDHAACLQRIVDAMATLPVHAIVTTGPAIDPSTVTASANVTVVAAAPHSQILPRASAVVHPRRARHHRARPGCRRSDDRASPWTRPGGQRTACHLAAVLASPSDGPPSQRGSRPQSSDSSTPPPTAWPPNVSVRRSAETRRVTPSSASSRPSPNRGRTVGQSLSKGAAYRNGPATAADHALSGRA